MLALLVAQNIAFYIIAALMVVGAIRVVTTPNVMHAALWLVLVLSGAAAQYILLAAEFVAITQVLVYLGAIIVLLVFLVVMNVGAIWLRRRFERRW
jgi:NADH-quinone oxidoreductase subunit J